MIKNQEPWPEPTVTNPGMKPPAKPANSVMPRQDPKASQHDGPYGGKKPQS